MNTSKQVNVMVGLLFLVVIAFAIYFIWDQNVRSGRAEDRQVEENAVRGAKLFAVNCRICHGPNGLGPLENPNFPGLPLDREENRPIGENALKPLRQRLLDTVKCGRVGTLMPPWAQAQGGPLNDTQIDQLVTLITGSGEGGASRHPNAVSEKAWKEALETAEEQDTLHTPGGAVLALAETLSADDTTITLNDAHVGLALDQLLRIGPIEDEKWAGVEIINVTAFPASSKLTQAVSSTDTVLKLEASADFKSGTTVQAEQEKMRVVDVDKDAKTITVERGVEGTPAVSHNKDITVQDPRNDIEVERGAFGTDAVQHDQGKQVFNGPIQPPTEPVTSMTCGQLAAAPAGTPAPGVPTPSASQPPHPGNAQPVQAELLEPANGVIETATADIRFTENNFKVKLGEEVTIRVTNEGLTLHNLRIAGLDGKWANEEPSDDDFVAPPGENVFLKNGEEGELTFRLDEAATLVFRCDVHPTQMWGQISVEQ